MTAPTISTEGLRELLERGAPVTVLDVRPAAERAEWSIPGSVHADVYDALRRGDPNALADFHPTNGGRVVTVCAAGKTSMLAAERLRARPRGESGSAYGGDDGEPHLVLHGDLLGRSAPNMRGCPKLAQVAP